MIGRSVYRIITPVYAVLLPSTKRTRVLLVCGNEILVVRSWLSDGRWKLPGGGLRRHEEPARGALRELREETGLSLPLEKFAGPQELQLRQGINRYTCYLYVITVSQTVPVRMRWPELTACQWVDYSKMSADNAYGDVTAAIKSVTAWTR